MRMVSPKGRARRNRSMRRIVDRREKFKPPKDKTRDIRPCDHNYDWVNVRPEDNTAICTGCGRRIRTDDV